MLCCLVRSGHSKWVMVLDRRCALCRTAWGTGGSYGAEVWGRHPRGPPVNHFGWDDDDWDDVCCSACVWEHPPFVLFLFPFGSLCFVSPFASLSLFLCSTDTPMSMGESNGSGRMLPSLPTSKTTTSQTLKANCKHLTSGISWLIDFSWNQSIILVIF